MNVQIDTTDQMFNINNNNNFRNSSQKNNYGYSNRANQQKASLQSVDGLLKSTRHNSSMKERSIGGQSMKSPGRKSIPMLSNENINPSGAREFYYSPITQRQLDQKQSGRSNCNIGNHQSPISRRFNFEKSIEDQGKTSGSRQILKDQKNENQVSQSIQQSPLELSQRNLLKRINNNNYLLQKQGKGQQETVQVTQQVQQQNLGGNISYGYSFGQYYLLNMHKIVKIQKYFRKRQQEQKKKLVCQNTLEIKNIECKRKLQDSERKESARNGVNKKELMSQSEVNSEQIYELKAENNQLKKSIFQLKLDMQRITLGQLRAQRKKGSLILLFIFILLVNNLFICFILFQNRKSQLESALLQQKSEMKDISDQYSSFLDKVVQDKKDLANRCLSLSRENTELKNENNQLKSEVEEIKKLVGIQEDQKQEEVEILRRQLDELKEKLKVLSEEVNSLKESNQQLMEMNMQLKQDNQIEQKNQYKQEGINQKCTENSEETRISYRNTFAEGYDTQKMQELQVLFVEIDEERQKAWEMVSKMKKAYEDLRIRCNEEKQLERAELQKFQTLMKQTIQKKDESIAQLNLVINNLRITFMQSNEIPYTSNLDIVPE